MSSIVFLLFLLPLPLAQSHDQPTQSISNLELKNRLMVPDQEVDYGLPPLECRSRFPLNILNLNPICINTIDVPIPIDLDKIFGYKSCTLEDENKKKYRRR